MCLIIDRVFYLFQKKKTSQDLEKAGSNFPYLAKLILFGGFYVIISQFFSILQPNARDFSFRGLK